MPTMRYGVSQMERATQLKTYHKRCCGLLQVILSPRGITWDGDVSFSVRLNTNDAVWGFTNGARDTSKDISQAVLRSAASNIQPLMVLLGIARQF